MKKLFAMMMTGVLTCSVMSMAHAVDSMEKDGMKRDEMAPMTHDGMKKPDANKGEMDKNPMSHDDMGKTPKDTKAMEHDGMKKEGSSY